MPPSLRALVRDCLVTDKNARIDSFDRIVERMTPILAEVQALPLRLPAPAPRAGETPPDPEGTAAMPAIVRPSNRPPPMSVPPSMVPAPDQPPTSGSAAPWAGSLPGYRASSRPPVVLFAIGGALLASFVIVAALGVVVFHRRATHDTTAEYTAQTTPTETAPPVPTVAPPASSEVPVISVDSLPVAPTSRVHLGRLSIESGPDECTVSIDGKHHGSTPASIEVPAGAHLVRCETSGGIAKTVTVTVVEGQTAHHHFLTGP